MTRLKSALLAATFLLGTGGLAIAQSGPAYDPAQLPAVQGKVAQYLLNPRGDVDGLLLADGTEVHFNPMLSTQLVFSVKPGDAITIHGLKAKAAPMVAAASITNDATGATVSGGGMGHPMHDRQGASVEAEGTVKAALHEPRGEIDGVLLEDGTIVRLPPNEARRLAAQLAVGQHVFARGFGSTSPLGKVVVARQIGADRSKLADVAMPRWGGRDSHPMMDGDSHGPMHGGPMMRGPGGGAPPTGG